jgi:NADH-quinone oxidoreductase subunit F
MMDAYRGGGSPSPAELAALASVPEGAPPDQLLPALHALNDHVGWISRPGLDEVTRRMEVAPAVAFGVASFYAMFSTTPRPPTVAYVCDDVPCRLAGAVDGIALIRAHLGAPGSPRDDAVWEASPCLGLCDFAPAALVDGRAVQAADPAAVAESLARAVAARRRLGGPPPAGDPPRPHVAATGPTPLLGRVLARVDPRDLDAYAAHGGLAGLRAARRLGSAGVLSALKASRLAGRGGAAFPAATKWEAVAQHPARPHYVVVNADESETGTFKDRILLEWDPYAVLEGAAIAAHACGAERVFIYIRGEYRHAHDRLAHAIREVANRDAFGEVLGDGCRLTFELRRGAGAYICGEETALLNSIEGKRGEPRSKPPFPVHHGLFGLPTVINNVETLACVPGILTDGADAFRARGTPDSPGTKLFSVSGHVARPGVYEVPSGTTLRALLDLAGGVRTGHQLRAIQCGGAAATMLGAADLDLPLTAEGLRSRGGTVGSGAIVALDETADILGVIRRGAEFFAHESCGQCVPCRIGTQRQVELLSRLAAGEDVSGLLGDVALAMRDASICGLGQTAASMVQSGLRHLRAS